MKAPGARASSPRLWRHRAAAEVRPRDRVILGIVMAAGVVATLRLADWWFRAGHIGNPALYVALSIAFWYGVTRILLGWVNYLAIAKVVHQPPTGRQSVAIFTTSAAGEPLSMFDKTLGACSRIRHPHTTYLLDDTRDPRFRELAAHHGAEWLELLDVPGAKAGKINAALGLTSEDVILVLDPDHVPFPEFLDRVLGHFDEAAVGFVQVAQAYYNQSRSFTAAAAAEQTYGFYGPVQMGLHGHRASVAIGANCTFRRVALDSIGGHGTGLAEDLVTAVRLHAAGWRSIYVPEVVSRGLVPEDLGSYYRQQLKWSRGVFEVAFAELPRLFGSLSWRQRLSYMTIGTYYLSGITTALMIILPYLYLWTGIQAASMRFVDLILVGGPVAVTGIVVYFLAQRWLVDRDAERGLHWRGLVLKLACWPVYLAGTLLAIARVDIPYIPTSKQAVRGQFFRLAWPQILLIAAYVLTLANVARTRLLSTSEGSLELTSEAVWGMLAFATVPVAMSFVALFAAWQSTRPVSDNAWEPIDISGIGESTA